MHHLTCTRAWDIKNATQQASRKTHSFRILSPTLKRSYTIKKAKKRERFANSLDQELLCFQTGAMRGIKRLQGISSSPWRHSWAFLQPQTSRCRGCKDRHILWVLRRRRVCKMWKRVQAIPPNPRKIIPIQAAPSALPGRAANPFS